MLVCLAGVSVLAANVLATVDSEFHCVLGGENGEVYAMVRQADGKILIGGDFTSVKGAVRYAIARLLPSGAVDLTFAPDLSRGECQSKPR